MHYLLPLLFLLNLVFISSLIQCQQNYSGNSVLNCYYNNSEPSSSSLYSCINQSQSTSSCISFLIFRSHYPFNSVPIIATLTSSNQSEIARINNVTTLTLFDEDTEVIIPVNCSCSGQYYKASTQYQIPSPKNTYFTIANDTFQGLSSCTSLIRENMFDQFKLKQGLELVIPLRCACPTTKQVANGVKYLLTYSVKWHDNLTSISHSFNISSTSLVESNSFVQENDTLYPFTTLLVPLPSEPFNRNHGANPSNSLPLPAVVVVTVRRRRLHTWILVGGIIAAIFALVIALIVTYCSIITHRKRSSIYGFTNICKTNDVKEDGHDSNRDIHVEIASNIDPVIRSFSYKELKKGTRNFGKKNRIKGSVYYGVVKKENVAIKKVQCKEASKEVSMLSKINHFNILKLCGFCENRGDCFLVFEYMKNGSLWEWLHKKKHENYAKTLPLKIHIAMDIANGLLYLHNFVKPPYVHKNINSEHILLDKNLRAKIASLGSARATNTNTNTNSNVRTRMVVGTKGYMAPEYINKGVVSTKIDVYAFGVVLLEMITEKEVVLDEISAATLAREDAEYRLKKIVEDDLGENGEVEYGFKVVRLCLKCLMQDPVDRPNMEEIVSVLMKIELNLQKSDRMWEQDSSLGNDVSFSTGSCYAKEYKILW